MPPADHPDPPTRNQRPYFVLCAVVALLSAGSLVYSETRAMAWAEGFHLLAAQMIKAGNKPYLDFCFPQTPLNAYWNAGWLPRSPPHWSSV